MLKLLCQSGATEANSTLLWAFCFICTISPVLNLDGSAPARWISACIPGIGRIGQAPQPVLLDEIVVFDLQDYQEPGDLYCSLGL